MKILIGGIFWESLTSFPELGKLEDFVFNRSADLLRALQLESLAVKLGYDPITTVYAQ